MLHCFSFSSNRVANVWIIVKALLSLWNFKAVGLFALILNIDSVLGPHFSIHPSPTVFPIFNFSVMATFYTTTWQVPSDISKTLTHNSWQEMRRRHPRRHHHSKVPLPIATGGYWPYFRQSRKPVPNSAGHFIEQSVPTMSTFKSTTSHVFRHYKPKVSSPKSHSDLRENIRATRAVWQLYNHCSGGFVQTFLASANAQGRANDTCLINFLVHSMRDGSIMLEQAKSRRFICFNRRRRLTARKLTTTEAKCQFREHLTRSGYTLLESTWQPDLFLGFNRKGRFQDPAQFFNRKYIKCFHYSKLEVSIDALSNDCDAPPKPRNRENFAERQEILYKLARDSLLSRVEIGIGTNWLHSVIKQPDDLIKGPNCDIP
ncbi:fibroblast growth factor domain-containing protein [Ditylenchus destructor]|nr:fibroblast growth factor domain-containing protein [Ditylenchus destructor]